jgi:DHA2 family multidrug resistance protein
MAVFRDRNFAVSVLILATFMFSMYGALDLQPLMLEHLYGYPTLTTGLVLAPRGIGSMISMFLAGRLINRIGARPLIVVGFACVLLGTWVNTWYAPIIDPFWIIWPILVQGFGLGLVFVPLATVSFATLPQSWSAEAAGVRQLGRTIGASLGISISSAIMARESQTAWNQMGGHITPFSDALRHYLANLHLTAHSPTAGAVLGQMLDKQATLQGIIDAFAAMSLTVLLGAPLLLLLRKGAGQSETAETGNAEK